MINCEHYSYKCSRNIYQISIFFKQCVKKCLLKIYDQRHTRENNIHVRNASQKRKYRENSIYFVIIHMYTELKFKVLSILKRTRTEKNFHGKLNIFFLFYTELFLYWIQICNQFFFYQVYTFYVQNYIYIHRITGFAEMVNYNFIYV